MNVELTTSAPAEAHLLTCVRWYLRFKRELIGIWPIWSENSTSASPRARPYVPEFEKCWQVYEQPVGDSGRVDTRLTLRCAGGGSTSTALLINKAKPSNPTSVERVTSPPRRRSSVKLSSATASRPLCSGPYSCPSP